MRRIAFSLHRLIVCGAVAGSLLACGNPVEQSQAEQTQPKDSTGPPGIHLISGPHRTDTANAFLDSALVLEFRDAAGHILRSDLAAASTLEGPPVALHLRRDDYGSPSLVQRIDSAGQLTFWVQLPKQVGTTRLVVRRLSDALSIEFTTLPGNPGKVVLSPLDSTMYEGGSYGIRSAVTDRWGNPRPEAATLEAANSVVTVSGSTVSAQSMGRGLVLGRVGSVVDTARVSVVPRGTLTAYWPSVNYATDTAAIVSIEMDGSGYQRILSANADHPQAPITTNWSPDGTTLVFADDDSRSGGAKMALYVWSNGRRSPLPPNPKVEWVAHPVFSHKGDWIYYSGPNRYLEYAIWRVRPDGSGAEQITPLELCFAAMPQASLSPDDSQLVYSISKRTIKVVDLATGHVRVLGQEGAFPQWSPLGTEIAYASTSGALMITRSDGVGTRQVSRSGSYVTDLRWSPDARYLIATDDYTGVFTLVDVRTGDALPLAFTRSLRLPTWSR